MSRVFTIVVILGLMAIVALVPRMGREAPGDHGPDLGGGYAYREDTLTRFRLLLEDPGWSHAEPPRNAQGMLEAVHEKTGLTFVLIPAGEFLMGSPEDEEGRWKSEGPVHRVTVPTFLLCKTECAQRAWKNRGGESDSEFKGVDLPVARVSWMECHEWCARMELRLPGESEWEFACRAGTKTPFSTGQSLTTDQANYNGNYPYGGGDQGENRDQAVAAGSLPPNPWGLHEMHGNVWEWCEDTWHGNYEGAPTDGTAWTNEDAAGRVLRGGSYFFYALHCRSAMREARAPRLSIEFVGFRPAADLPN